MVIDPILSGYKAGDVRQFVKDFAEMIRVSSEMDMYFVRGEKDFNYYIKGYKKVLADFNKKYKGVKLKTVTRADCYDLRIFLKEKDVGTVFEKSAFRIKGMVSIGLKGFNEVETSDGDKYGKAVGSINKSLYLTYSDADAGTSSLALKYNASSKMVEVIVDNKELMNTNSVDFKVVAFYALMHGVKSKINLHDQLISFGFYNLLNEIEKREWFEKFSPRFLE
tara:strand:+ start:210 stop:875 length:666 start_codon:yes stop_codon:yes gene_type:complete